MREHEKLDEADRSAINLRKIVTKWVPAGSKRRRLVSKIMEIWERRFWGTSGKRGFWRK